MINKTPPFKGLNIRISFIIPIEGRELINQGSGVTLKLYPVRMTVLKRVLFKDY